MKRQQKFSIFELLFKTKKAQAALEFLTTYGWALFMMAAAVSALIYFGIFDVKGSLPERCTFSNDFHCHDFRIVGGADQNASMLLINTYGQTIVYQNVSCTLEDGQIVIDNTNQDTDWNPKGAIRANCVALSGQPFLSGQKAKVLVTVWYRLESGGFDHFGEGEILANVQ